MTLTTKAVIAEKSRAEHNNLRLPHLQRPFRDGLPRRNQSKAPNIVSGVIDNGRSVVLPNGFPFVGVEQRKPPPQIARWQDG